MRQLFLKVHMMETRLSTLLPLMEEAFRQGECFTIYPGGTSMLPLLRPHEDGVRLAPPPEEIRRGDVLLCRRRDGSFVLHRVLRLCGETFEMVGDNQLYREGGFRRDNVVAKAIGRVREEVYQSFEEGPLARYGRRRLRTFPIRSFFGRLKKRLCKTRKKNH